MRGLLAGIYHDLVGLGLAQHLLIFDELMRDPKNHRARARNRRADRRAPSGWHSRAPRRLAGPRRRSSRDLVAASQTRPCHGAGQREGGGSWESAPPTPGWWCFCRRRERQSPPTGKSSIGCGRAQVSRWAAAGKLGGCGAHDDHLTWWMAHAGRAGHAANGTCRRAARAA